MGMVILGFSSPGYLRKRWSQEKEENIQNIITPSALQITYNAMKTFEECMH
jgi:hypothetical protein